MIKCPSLEVTGNFLEVPPAREPTNTRKQQRPSMTGDSLLASAASSNVRRRSSVVSKSSSLKPTATTPPSAQSVNLQRSVSQQSTSVSNHKKSNVSNSDNKTQEVINYLTN